MGRGTSANQKGRQPKMRSMAIEDLYRHWAADRLGISVRSIEAATVHSDVGTGSPSLDDSDFSTFAGVEIYSLWVDLKNGEHEFVRLFDRNPVEEILDFAKRKRIKIVKPTPDPDAALRQAIEGGYC